MKKFFVNAPGPKRRRKKRKAAKAAVRRRRRRMPGRTASGRFVSRKKKGKVTVARKRRSRKRNSARRRSTARRSTRRVARRRRRSVAVAAPVRRRRRRRSYAGNPRRVRRRRGYRRNPGLVGTLMRGMTDALMVTGGKVANNLVAKNLPFSLPLPGIAGDVVKALGVATLVSYGAGKFLSGDKARMVSAGAFQSVVEGLVRGLNIPMVSTALGEYDILGNSYNGLGAYARPMIAPVVSRGGMGAYPAPEFEGEQFAYDQAG